MERADSVGEASTTREWLEAGRRGDPGAGTQDKRWHHYVPQASRAPVASVVLQRVVKM